MEAGTQPPTQSEPATAEEQAPARSVAPTVGRTAVG